MKPWEDSSPFFHLCRALISRTGSLQSPSSIYEGSSQGYSCGEQRYIIFLPGPISIYNAVDLLFMLAIATPKRRVGDPTSMNVWNLRSS